MKLLKEYYIFYWVSAPHFLPQPFLFFILANIANGNALPIAADYVWKILAFWSQDSLGTTYKLHKIKFHF